MPTDLAENEIFEQSENPCTQGLGRSDVKVLCKKTCGSIGCKRDFLKQQCLGIYPGACVGVLEKSGTDRTKANACISGNVDMHWLVKKNTRNNNSLPQQGSVHWVYLAASSHLDNERYFHPS